MNYSFGVNVAQLVVSHKKKPGAMLMQVQISGVARDVSPRVPFSADSITVLVQPLRAIACIDIQCVHVKNLKR